MAKMIDCNKDDRDKCDKWECFQAQKCPHPVNPIREQWKKVIATAQTGDVENTLSEIVKWMDTDREQYIARGNPHAGVVSCLEGAAEHCRHAAFAFYASTK